MENYYVSVILRTLNQGNVIIQTIDSILQQITNFDFELIIYDENSAEETTDAIKLYVKKYPQKVKLVTRKEDITPRGKYIALCNGGDIWMDPNKLQIQFEVIEQHPEINICVHATTTLSRELNRPIGRKMPYKYNSVIETEQLIDGGENFIAEGSVLYRASIDENIPVFRKENPTFYSLLMHASLNGALYISDNMASCIKSAKLYDEIQLNNRIKSLEMFDEYTNRRYSSSIEMKKLECEFLKLKLNENYTEMKNEKYKALYKKLSFIEKIKMLFK